MNRESNPWLTGWTQPKETIQTVLATNPKKGFVPILFVNALVGSFSIAYAYSFGSQKNALFLFTIAFSLYLFCYAIGIYFMGWLLRVTGKMLGGTSSSQTLRAVAVWSSLPNLLSTLVWSSLIILKQESAFVLNINHKSALLINLLMLTTFFWQAFLIWNMIQETQQFSKARAFFNLALYYLVVFSIALISLITVASIYNSVFNPIK